MADGDQEHDSLAGWLDNLKPGSVEGGFSRVATHPGSDVAVGPIDLSPLPGQPHEGEPYSLPFFGEMLRGAATLTGGAGMAELAYNVRRYLAFTRSKLANVYQALRPKERDTFSVLPYLLHANVPGLPGYIAEEGAPHGISNFELNATIRRGLDDVFPGRRVTRNQAMYRPSIRSLLAMGSVGTIGQSGKSDVDYWVVVDESSLSPIQQRLLLQKVDAVETWARKRGLDCHFFLVDTGRARMDDFGSGADDSESAGSAQGKLLKEEFYRTAVFITGELPLWWVAPVGVDAAGYTRLAHAVGVAALVPSLSFVDLGYVGEIDRGEFFGAALWQINKSLQSPFKSLLKMALLAKYLDEENPVLLCDVLKERVFAGESGPQYTDPYVLLFDAISEYFAGKGDWAAFKLVQKSFYLKIGLKLSRQRVERVRFVERFRVMHAYITRWGWSPSLLEELDGLESWSAERVDAMGQEIRQFMLGLYRQLIDQARTAAVRINETDVTILGRRLFACFGQEGGKVAHLFTYFLREARTEERLVVLEVPEAPPERRWEVHRGLKREEILNRAPPIRSGATLAEVAAWLTFNGLFDPTTVVGLIGRGSQTSTADFRAMLERFHASFECPDPFSIPPPAFLEPRRTVRAALVVNLDLDRPIDDASEAAGVYYLPENWDILNYGRSRESRLRDVSVATLNTWGEVFCRRYSGNLALPAALRDLFRGIDPDAPLDADPEILAPHDRSLPAVRNRLREVLDRSRDVLLEKLAPGECRTFVYEVGGRFQVLHRSPDSQRLTVTRSVRGVTRMLGSLGPDTQTIYIDRLSPTLGDVRALVERHSTDRDPHVYIGWRLVRESGYVIVCDSTRRVYITPAPGPDTDVTLVRVVRRVLQHMRSYVTNANALRKALRVFELREGRALGHPTQLAEDTTRVLGLIRGPRETGPELWLRGDFRRGRSGVYLQVGDKRFSADEYGRAFVLHCVRHIVGTRSRYDAEAFLIDGSAVDFGAEFRPEGYDAGVVKHLRLIDAYERWIARARAAYRGEGARVLSSTRGFHAEEFGP